MTAQTPAPSTPQATPASHGLPGAAVAKIHATLASFPAIETATLYGSRALGRHRPGSDIDLTLAGAGLDGRTLGRLDAALDDLLLPWRFDLSLQSSLQSAELIDHIQRVGQLFYSRSDRSQLRSVPSLQPSHGPASDHDQASFQSDGKEGSPLTTSPSPKLTAT